MGVARHRRPLRQILRARTVDDFRTAVGEANELHAKGELFSTCIEPEPAPDARHWDDLDRYDGAGAMEKLVNSQPCVHFCRGSEVRTADGRSKSSTRLYFILLMLCRGAPLDQVVNAGPSEGLEAWRQLVLRRETTCAKTLRWTTPEVAWLELQCGDDVARLEPLERQAARLHYSSGETLTSCNARWMQERSGST